MASSHPTTTQSTFHHTWQSPLWLLVILCIAAAVRFYALDHSSLWSDEGNTYALIQRTYSTIAQDAAADIHPPGYYWQLKAWTTLFGISAASMRAYSALLGMLLVAVVYAIGRQLDAQTNNRALIAPTAAILAALNPFQIYYSQEARMYMLLAVAGATLFWALVVWIEIERANVSGNDSAHKSVHVPMLGFIASGIVGMWTQYSYPILIFAAGVAYLWHWRGLLQITAKPMRLLMRYILANLVILLAFAPWLPTAINRVLQWPKGGEAITLFDGMLLTWRTLTFGPLRDVPEPLWPWLIIAAILPLLGIIAIARYPQGIAISLWLLAPIGLMFALGLFNDAFLKLLLTASPAWALLCACAPLLLPRARWGTLVISIGSLALAASVIPTYYTSPTVRDNYAGVAAYIEAVGNPTSDLVILNAPGQGDVWSYYNPGFTTIGLPQSRPPDPASTISDLEATVQDRRQIFTLFWATDEADPDRIVETWLDQHAFRGLERWQGNLRFVVYTLPNQLNCQEFTPPATFGNSIQLLAQCQPTFPQRIPAGQVAMLGLQWQTQTPLAQNYKITVQLLDQRSQVIAQHDSEPAGGSRPTSSWEPQTPIMDNHGLTIPFGAPPGQYRLIAALYDDTGRLPTPTGDAYELGEIEVVRPTSPLPLAILPIAHAVDAQLGPITLVGYDAYKKDHSYAPQTPMQAGDIAHFTFYWQAPDPLPSDWPDDLTFTLMLGEQSLTAPLAGGAYPTGVWQAGEVIRGEFDLTYDGNSLPILEVTDGSVQLKALPR